MCHKLFFETGFILYKYKISEKEWYYYEGQENNYCSIVQRFIAWRLPEPGNSEAGTREPGCGGRSAGRCGAGGDASLSPITMKIDVTAGWRLCLTAWLILRMWNLSW